MYSYTKQEVQEFLGTANNNNQALLRSLRVRNITAETNGRRGANLLFILDKELVDPMIKEFGFKPTRPETTRALLKAFHDFGGQLNMSWAAVSEYIKATQGINIAPNNLSTVYNELMENEKVCPVVRNIVLNNGQPLTDEERDAFDEYLAGIRQWNSNMSITFRLALSKFNYQSVKVKEVSAY